MKRTYCEANKERIKAWREANKERIKAYREANREEIRKQRREHYYANREEILERNRAWNRDNKERVRERRSAWNRDNKERIRAYTNEPANKDRARNRHYLANYGISLAEYERILMDQGGTCACCGKPPPASGRRKRLAVDHCHTTGKVRGLLCDGCNTGIGSLGDTIPGLNRAIKYLENTQLKEAK